MVGQFKPVYFAPDNPDFAVRWERAVPEEGTVVTVHALKDALELSLSPAISTYHQHHGKRIAAGIYFEIATRYAEKVGGVIIQRATVDGCTMGETSKELLLASYPAMPMSFDRICQGFQEAILGDNGYRLM